MILAEKNESVKFLEKCGIYSLCLTLALVAAPRSWALYPLGLFLFCGLLLWLLNFREVLKKVKLQFLLPLVIYFILYIVYSIGNFNWSFIEDKLMFLLIPVLGLPVFASGDFMKRFEIIVKSYVCGLLLICLFLIARALTKSISISGTSLAFDPFIQPGISWFNWQQLAFFDHPTYLAIEILWAISLIIIPPGQLKLPIWAKLTLVCFFIFFVFLLSVRSGILILVLLILYTGYLYQKSSKQKLLFVIILGPLILAGAYLAAGSSQRMKDQIGFIKAPKTGEKPDWKNLEPRTRSWYSSAVLIAENPVLGVGPGARDTLAAEHRRRGFTTEADVRLNCHNQYLETQLTFGIPGTIILLWMLLVLLEGRKRLMAPILVIPFLLIISVSMLFESILVRQWGIMFYVLFFCILSYPGKTSG